MTTEIQAKPRRSFVTSLLPWAITIGMLMIYVFTLNHSVSTENLTQVMDVSGWDWRPNVFGPVTFLITYPFRWLPASVVPIALNFLAALCGALTLGILARSVSILPHDRTYDQRQRESSRNSILSVRSAWLPPLFAALVCGLQLSFWENSVEATGQIIDVLIFAYCIRCLLEYRIDQKESWLLRFAIVCGAGMANNWAMIGFFPAFLAALIWIKGTSFFNVRFLLRFSALGLAGLLLVLLLPIKASITHSGTITFGQALRSLGGTDKFFLWDFWRNYLPNETLVVLCLLFLLPVLAMGIRWPSSFGDRSPLGIFLATSMFHVVHALFLGACLWVALDPPFSPRQRIQNALGVSGLSFLTFYYLAALCVGYYSGYFLLVFGTKLSKSRNRTHPFMKLLNPTAVVIVWVLLLCVPTLLVIKNLPKVSMNRKDHIATYSKQVMQQMPEKGGVILSDEPFRLLFLEAYLTQIGKAGQYLLLDTVSLANQPAYFDFIAKKYPRFKFEEFRANGTIQTTASLELINLLAALSREHELFYLHPSFGYYFEAYRMKPQGLVYKLEAYATNAPVLPPLPSKQEVEQNQAYWSSIADETLVPLAANINGQSAQPAPALVSKLFDTLHLAIEKDNRSQLPAGYYSTALNFWGVQMQKLGKLAEAQKLFSQAHELNPENVSAEKNLQFNKELAAGKKPVIAPPKAIEDKFGKRRSWTEILVKDGPFDDPNFCFELGSAFARGGLYRQAIEQFDRVQSLAPDNTPARLWLAQMYISTHSYPNALEITENILKEKPTDPDALFLESVTLIQMKEYDRAIAHLDTLMTAQTNNYPAQLNRAIAYLKTGQFDKARSDYEVIAKVAPTAYQAHYGLAEIAYKQHDVPTAVKYYKRYLTNAPPETEEVKLVETRLKELGKDSQ